MFGYNYLAAFKENSVTVFINILVNYDKGILETTKLQFLDIDDCNIILIPANQTNTDDIIYEEDCVELLELNKNNKSIILNIPCINLEV